MALFNVLIVPYGIETWKSTLWTIRSLVLIVPYGIETCKQLVHQSIYHPVLIVPYGIETEKDEALKCHFVNGVNCTLWN